MDEPKVTFPDDPAEFQAQFFAWTTEARNRGYAGTFFTPEEVRGADVHDVSDRMVEDGFDAIADLVDEEGEGEEG